MGRDWGKLQYTEKNPRNKERINNISKPTHDTGPGLNLGQVWEVSTLTNVTSLYLFQPSVNLTHFFIVFSSGCKLKIKTVVITGHFGVPFRGYGTPEFASSLQFAKSLYKDKRTEMERQRKVRTCRELNST